MNPGIFGTEIRLILISFMFWLLVAQSENGFSQDRLTNKDKIKIDSVSIKKNWRTKESIILDELGLNLSDSINSEQLQSAISRIWNIGNFAKVNYHLDTLKDGRLLLDINAQDALTIVPVFSFSGNKQEYQLVLGVHDNNFLGRNINLGIAGGFGTNARYANINLGIPRQLLFKNMTLDAGFNLGEIQNYKYAEGEKISGIAYLQKSFSFQLGNPYQTDYYYTFSPNLGLSYFNQVTDSTLLESGIRPLGDYDASYLGISVSESIGLMNQIRHQRNGYLFTAAVGSGIGLNYQSPGYLSFGLSGTYANLINKVIELDAGFSGGYTTSELPSLINYLGPGHVKGILTGERSGKAIYAAKASINFTYINKDWFAIEQSFFFNIGNASDKYSDLYTSSPLYSAGSHLRLLVPMIPWMSIGFYYAYRGNGKHWYSFDL